MTAPSYRELPPPQALRGVVACLWVHVPGRLGEGRIVPDGCTDVVWQRGHGATVCGPDTTAKLVSYLPDDVFVGIRFHPGAGGSVLRVPVEQLRDLRVDVAEIDPAFALDADLAPDEVLRRFVAVTANRECDPLMAQAVRLLDDQPVSAIARELWVSERQLRRRFHAAVGYGPKTLVRVLRFHRFVAGIDRGRTDLAALALDAGYADQAHLTRESTRLAGLPPLALMHARGPAAETSRRP